MQMGNDPEEVIVKQMRERNSYIISRLDKPAEISEVLEMKLSRMPYLGIISLYTLWTEIQMVRDKRK